MSEREKKRRDPFSDHQRVLVGRKPLKPLTVKGDSDLRVAEAKYGETWEAKMCCSCSYKNKIKLNPLREVYKLSTNSMEEY